MRTNYAYALAAIVIGFGIGDGSATNLDLRQLSNGASRQGLYASDPSLAQGAGFSALKSELNALKAEASSKGLSSPVVSRETLVRPEEGHAWHSGFAAFARLTGKDASQEAIVGAPEMPRSNGFSALKAGVERGAHGLAAPSARQEGIREASEDRFQRPAGTQWSNGFQGLRR